MAAADEIKKVENWLTLHQRRTFNTDAFAFYETCEYARLIPTGNADSPHEDYWDHVEMGHFPLLTPHSELIRNRVFPATPNQGINMQMEARISKFLGWIENGLANCVVIGIPEIYTSISDALIEAGLGSIDPEVGILAIPLYSFHPDAAARIAKQLPVVAQ